MCMAGTQPTPSFASLIAQRYSRRALLRAGALTLVASQLPLAARATASTNLSFSPVPAGMDETHHVAAGYRVQTLLRWGDAVLADAPAFNPLAQSEAAQATQFGFNNDFVAYLPLSDAAPNQHGLLCVNHEYATGQTMFAGSPKSNALSAQQCRVEMASLGCSVVEVKQDAAGQWRSVFGTYNRRITATTPMQLRGAAAGHARMQTRDDPDGRTVLGTFGNCAGGVTPWGTYLSCEENVDEYFWLGDYSGDQLQHHRDFGISRNPFHRWDVAEARFDVSKHPNEPNRFGWVVELDPRNPESTPIKRTSLGRFKHESATTIVNADGRLVVYMGDDEAFEHVYKYVSAAPYRAGEDASALLDEGTLFVARFDADGSLHWLPLVFGMKPLTPANGFTSQADVMIEARRAAKLLGATPMDRPEDIAIHPHTGEVYAAMTHNPRRLVPDAVNRRAPNLLGYVVKFAPTDGDHAATLSHWELVLQGSSRSLACPDNLAFDAQGNLWIATDGQPKMLGIADALYGCDVSAAKGRVVPKALFRAPVGAEVTGPCFTPDNRSLFLSVQHPAEHSTYDKPSTRWPDFNDTMPPRSAVVVIQKQDGGVVGS
jgi:uncharacterized protein